MIKKITLLLFALCCIMPANYAAAKKNKKATWGSSVNYEVQTVGVGQDGTKVIKVWGYSKKVNDAIIQAKKNAISACLFRGLTGTSTANATPPLCTDPNAEVIYQDYFDKFFETDGAYMRFVNRTTDETPSGTDRLKISKEYKVGITVQVMYDQLRKQLEADGIIKKLNSGF